MGDLMELAKRLAAHPKWIPAAGMLVTSPRYQRAFADESEAGRVLTARANPDNSVDVAVWYERETRFSCWVSYAGKEVWPLLDDPATAGCLHAMLCATVNSQRYDQVGLRFTGDCYVVEVERHRIHELGATPGEAIAKALLACWEVTR